MTHNVSRASVATMLIALLWFLMSTSIYFSAASREREIKRLQAISLSVSSVEDAYYVVNQQGDCVFATDGLCRLIGIEKVSIIGKNMHFLLHHHRANGTVYPIVECEMFRAMKENRVTSLRDDTIWAISGETIRCSWTSVPFKTDSDVFTKITILPIAERARSEQRLH